MITREIWDKLQPGDVLTPNSPDWLEVRIIEVISQRDMTLLIEWGDEGDEYQDTCNYDTFGPPDKFDLLSPNELLESIEARILENLR